MKPRIYAAALIAGLAFGAWRADASLSDVQAYRAGMSRAECAGVAAAGRKGVEIIYSSESGEQKLSIVAREAADEFDVAAGDAHDSPSTYAHVNFQTLSVGAYHFGIRFSRYPTYRCESDTGCIGEIEEMLDRLHEASELVRSAADRDAISCASDQLGAFKEFVRTNAHPGK